MDCEAYGRLALWIDAAFQALGVLTFERHGLKVLPSKVGRLALSNATPSTTLKVRTLIDAIDDTDVHGDVLITNADDEPILSMTAISMAVIGQPERTATAMSLTDA